MGSKGLVTGLSIGSNGAIVSWGNNHLAGNTGSDGVFTTTIAPD